MTDRDQLTRREAECIAWAAKGKTAREIAMIEGISANTAAQHLKAARSKLGAVNIAQACVLFDRGQRPIHKGRN